MPFLKWHSINQPGERGGFRREGIRRRAEKAEHESLGLETSASKISASIHKKLR